MESYFEWGITIKDRIVILDKELDSRNLNTKEIHTLFHQHHGKHYKNLKQGPGWSFPKKRVCLQGDELVEQEPCPQEVKKETITTPTRFLVDIPLDIRKYVQDYQILFESIQ